MIRSKGIGFATTNQRSFSHLLTAFHHGRNDRGKVKTTLVATLYNTLHIEICGIYGKDMDSTQHEKPIDCLLIVCHVNYYLGNIGKPFRKNSGCKPVLSV